MLGATFLAATGCASDAGSPSSPAATPSSAPIVPDPTGSAASNQPPPGLDHLVDPSATCEELQIDYANVRHNARHTCTSDSQCRCSAGGVVPARLCGGAEFRTTSTLLDTIREHYVKRCPEMRCDGKPCSASCSDFRCSAVCREGACVNAIGENER